MINYLDKECLSVFEQITDLQVKKNPELDVTLTIAHNARILGLVIAKVDELVDVVNKLNQSKLDKKKSWFSKLFE